MKSLVGTLLICFALSFCASAQVKEDVPESLQRNIGFGGGWVHVTGDGGTDGFNVNAEVLLFDPIAIGFDYDNAWDNSNLGVFQFTQTGAIATHSHLQNVIIGPRVYIPRRFRKNKTLRFLLPFLEAQFGGSRLTQKITSATSGSASATSTGFAWEAGGGADMKLNQHWSFRPKIDYLHTSFSSSGQSHLRFTLGLMYTLRSRY